MNNERPEAAKPALTETKRLAKSSFLPKFFRVSIHRSGWCLRASSILYLATRRLGVIRILFYTSSKLITVGILNLRASRTEQDQLRSLHWPQPRITPRCPEPNTLARFTPLVAHSDVRCKSQCYKTTGLFWLIINPGSGEPQRKPPRYNTNKESYGKHEQQLYCGRHLRTFQGYRHGLWRVGWLWRVSGSWCVGRLWRWNLFITP